MNHKKSYRQVYGCGQLLDSYEKANLNIKSPTPAEYNALPPDIKAQYPNYNSYKTAVDTNNAVTRTAMSNKLKNQKTDYISYTGGNASEKNDFDAEADLLISELENTRANKISG